MLAMDNEHRDSPNASSDGSPSGEAFMAPASASASVVSASNTASSSSPGDDAAVPSDKERRASIQAIMRDSSLNETERRRSIQKLMDGRRHSSLVNFRRCSSISFGRNSITTEIGNTATAAKIVQDEFSDIDDGDDSKDGGSVITPTSPVTKPRQMLKRSSCCSSPSAHENTSAGLRSLQFDQMHLNDMRASVLSNGAYNLQGDPVGSPKILEESRPPCSHYERKCSVISPCCGMVFGCRLCHDDCDQLNPPIYNEDVMDSEEESEHIPRKIKLEHGAKAARRGSMSSIMSAISEMGDDVHHNIDRFAINEIICRECFTRQDSKT